MNRKLLIILVVAIAIGGGAAIYYLSSNSNDPASVDPVPDTPVTPDEPKVLEVDTLRTTLKVGDTFGLRFYELMEGEETDGMIKIVITSIEGDIVKGDTYINEVLQPSSDVSTTKFSDVSTTEFLESLKTYVDYETVKKMWLEDSSFSEVDFTVTKETAVMDTELGKRNVTIETHSYSRTDLDGHVTLTLIYGEEGLMYDFKAEILGPHTKSTDHFTILECSLYE